MDKLICINGKIEIPEKHAISKIKRRLFIKMPYCSRVERLCEDDFNITSQTYFRQKNKDKPFIPEGFIEIDGVRYAVIEEKKKKEEQKRKDERERKE